MIHFLGPKCIKSELSDNPEYISLIETKPFVFPDHITYGSGGTNFNKLPVEIYVLLTPDSIGQVEEIGFFNRKSNVAKFEVSVLDFTDRVIETKTNNRKVKIETEEPIKAFRIVITETKDGANPRAVELSIKGCKNVTHPTTAPVFVTTTPPGKSFMSVAC